MRQSRAVMMSKSKVELRGLVGRGSKSPRWSPWLSGFGALGIGTLITVAAITSGVNKQFTGFRSEVVVAVMLLTGFASALLVLGAVVGRRRRDFVYAAIGLSILIAHPIFDLFFSNQNHPFRMTRQLVGAMAIASLALTMEFRSPSMRAAKQTAGVLFLTTITLLGSNLLVGESWIPHSAELAGALLAIVIGAMAFKVGRQELSPAMIAVGSLSFSIGYGCVLLLINGRPEVTVSVAVVSVSGAVLMVAAALTAVIDALRRRDAFSDLQNLAKSMEVDRLNVKTDRYRELVHNERSSLLAMEAAARSLSRHPSQALAASLTAEVIRLQHTLDEVSNQRATFDVSDTVRKTVDFLRAGHPQITLETADDCLAMGDPGDVTEVVRTLVDNAFDHGRPPVAVAVHRSGDNVVVSVTDSGGGIIAELHESVFAHGVTTEPRSHSGLGLFTARRLARQVGGDLIIAGSPQRFEFTLATGSPTSCSQPAELEDESAVLRSADG